MTPREELKAAVAQALEDAMCEAPRAMMEVALRAIANWFDNDQIKHSWQQIETLPAECNNIEVVWPAYCRSDRGLCLVGEPLLWRFAVSPEAKPPPCGIRGVEA